MSVYEEGFPEQRICLIGEAPGRTEMAIGKPFCGPAGHLLDSTLHAAKIPRSSTYIINVFETPVSKKADDASTILSEDKRLILWTATKGFTEAGLEACRPAWERLRRCTANVICPMGGPAFSLARMVADASGNPVNVKPLAITKWRGSVIPGIDGRKIIPTLHPASALRGVYEWRYYIIRDLRRVLDNALFPDIRNPRRNLIIDPTFDQCIAFLERMKHVPSVATDIETLQGGVSCFSICHDPLEAISIPIIDADFDSRFSEAEELQIWQLYAEIIGSPDIVKINQNITFDLAVLLERNHIVPRGRLEDIMVAHSVMYPFLNKGLGTICSMHATEPYYKDDGTLEDASTVADFGRYWEYSAKDSAIAMESWLALDHDLDESGARQTYEMTISLIPALMFMMVNGMLIDVEALARTRQTAEHNILNLIERIAQTLNIPVITKAPKTSAEKKLAAGKLNINSPIQLAKFFYDSEVDLLGTKIPGLKLKPYVNKDGQRTTDDKALARIFRRDGLPIAKLLQEYRAADKMLGTYLEAGWDSDKRMRCSYNIRGTWTGRLSSGQTTFGTGLNFQNIPPEMRGFFVGDNEIDMEGEEC